MNLLNKNKPILSLILLSSLSTMPLLIVLLSLIDRGLVYSLWPITNYIIGIFGCIILIADIIKNKFKINKRTIIILIFLIILLIACIISKNPKLAFKGTIYRCESYFMYLNYFIYFYLGTNLEKKQIIVLLKYITIVSAIISIITGFSTPNFSIIHDNLFKYIFYNLNHLGYYLSLTSLIGMYLYIYENSKKRYIYLFLYIINIICLISNNTFGSYLGVFLILIFSTIVLVIRKEKKERIIIPIIIFIISSLLITNKGKIIVLENFKDLTHDTHLIAKSYEINKNFESDEIKHAGNRLELWTTGIKLLKEKPLLGYGLENIAIEYYKTNLQEDRPHNCILEIGLNMGIIGIIIYIYYLIIETINTIKSIKKSNIIHIGIYMITISYFISSLFGNSTFYITPYYFFMIGILQSIKKQNVDKI